MKRFITLFAMLTAALLLAVAALALAGVAALRQPSPLAVSLATSLLLILPVLGLASLFEQKRVGLLVGAHSWPILLLIGLPLYFPEERGVAINTGLTLLGLPFGEPLSKERRLALSQALDEILVEPRSARPSPTAAEAREVVPPPSRIQEGEDQVALPYEGAGHSLLIPVALEGPQGQQIEFDMLFDTGATYTTLDRRTLALAGYQPQPDAPEIAFHTAKGESSAKLVIVDRLWLGGFDASGVTIAICEACAASEEHAGLLGLNVSSRFLITLDTARKEMILEPRQDDHRAHLDVRPWLELDGRGTTWPDGRTEVRISGTNLADRVLQKAIVEIECAERRYEAELAGLGSGETRLAQVSIPPRADCNPFSIDLAHGQW